MYLFGSYAKGKGRPDSNIDVFIESQEELRQIPSELLITNSGPIDAFWMPDEDNWALAVGEEKTAAPRMLIRRDVKSVSISVNQLLCICKNLNLNKKKEQDVERVRKFET